MSAAAFPGQAAHTLYDSCLTFLADTALVLSIAEIFTNNISDGIALKIQKPIAQSERDVATGKSKLKV